MREHEKGGALTEATYLILLALVQPRHGYSVMQFIEERTSGRVRLGPGTLYGALSLLTQKGWIAPVEERNPSARKKEYALTPLGEKALLLEIARLKSLAALGGEIIQGGK